MACRQTGARGHLAEAPVITQASFRLPGALQDPVHRIVSGTFQDLRDLAIQRKAVDARIARAHRLRSLPGIGPVFAAGVGDITRFPDNDQLAPCAGLT